MSDPPTLLRCEHRLPGARTCCRADADFFAIVVDLWVFDFAHRLRRRSAFPTTPLCRTHWRERAS